MASNFYFWHIPCQNVPFINLSNNKFTVKALSRAIVFCLKLCTCFCYNSYYNLLMNFMPNKLANNFLKTTTKSNGLFNSTFWSSSYTFILSSIYIAALTSTIICTFISYSKQAHWQKSPKNCKVIYKNTQNYKNIYLINLC